MGSQAGVEQAGWAGCSLRATTTPPQAPSIPEAGRAAGWGTAAGKQRYPRAARARMLQNIPTSQLSPAPAAAAERGCARGSSLWKSHSLQLPSRIISIKGKLFSSSLEESCVPVAAAAGTSFPFGETSSQHRDIHTPSVTRGRALSPGLPSSCSPAILQEGLGDPLPSDHPHQPSPHGLCTPFLLSLQVPPALSPGSGVIHGFSAAWEHP